MRELKENGLNRALASRVISAMLKAIDSEENLLAVLDEIKKRGKTNIAAMLWSEHIASLLLCIPRKYRRKFVKIVLKLADEMEKG